MNKTEFPYRFFLVTFIWSWIFWIFLALASQDIIQIPSNILSKAIMPISIIGAFGPLVGAIYSIHKEKGNVIKYLRRFTDIKLGWKAYVFPILIFGISTFIAWFFPELFGEKRLNMLLPSIWVFIPFLIIMTFFGGGQEEFGWRGYALPILEKKYGLWGANIVLGIIWGFWHLPLWFITGTNQTYMNFGGFVLISIGYSFIFSWIKNISGDKLFTGLYVHGIANAIIPIFPVFSMQHNTPQPRFWIWVILTLSIGIIITIVRNKNIVKHANNKIA